MGILKCVRFKDYLEHQRQKHESRRLIVRYEKINVSKQRIQQVLIKLKKRKGRIIFEYIKQKTRFHHQQNTGRGITGTTTQS